MAQSMALASGSKEADDRLSLIAGEAPASLPGSADDIRVVSLVGDPMDWSGPRDRFPQFVRSGGYVMQVGEKTYGLSVQGAVEEGVRRIRHRAVRALDGRNRTFHRFDGGQQRI